MPRIDEGDFDRFIDDNLSYSVTFPSFGVAEMGNWRTAMGDPATSDPPICPTPWDISLQHGLSVGQRFLSRATGKPYMRSETAITRGGIIIDAVRPHILERYSIKDDPEIRERFLAMVTRDLFEFIPLRTTVDPFDGVRPGRTAVLLREGSELVLHVRNTNLKS